jgi:hypothetical protein
MFQKLKALPRRGLDTVRQAGIEVKARVVNYCNNVRNGMKLEQEQRRLENLEGYEAREREKKEAREGLRQAVDDMKKSWQALPPWPMLMPAVLMLTGFVSLIIWALTNAG